MKALLWETPALWVTRASITASRPGRRASSPERAQEPYEDRGEEGEERRQGRGSTCRRRHLLRVNMKENRRPTKPLQAKIKVKADVKSGAMLWLYESA